MILKKNIYRFLEAIVDHSMILFLFLRLGLPMVNFTLLAAPSLLRKLYISHVAVDIHVSKFVNTCTNNLFRTSYN